MAALSKVQALSQLTREWGYPRQFEWGQSDCAAFANRACELIRGVPALPNWPKYSTALGAQKALKKAGFEHLDAALDHYLERLPDGSVPKAGDLFAMSANQDGPWHATAISHGGWRGFVSQPGRSWILIDVKPEYRTGAVWRIANG
jgi:hypothetical protein